jgi:Fe-S oxidoreductase
VVKLGASNAVAGAAIAALLRQQFASVLLVCASDRIAARAELCKRTGKPCMFVKSSGLSSFGKVMNEVGISLDGHRAKPVGEFLGKQKAAGKLDTNFTVAQGKVAYHVPCHLRAQNVGQPFRALLDSVPGTKVEPIEQCSAFDGTWGMKTEYYETSRKCAGKLCSAMPLQVQERGQRHEHPEIHDLWHLQRRQHPFTSGPGRA